MYKQRKNSYFYNMRIFHNTVKRNLYNKYLQDPFLLDLACGKCGDLDKWVSNKLQVVLGYDINPKSVIHGMKRIANYNIPELMYIDICVQDLSTNIVKLLQDNSFGTVSCMFAFHYFFKTKESFETIIKSIKNNLKDGGYFIGTMFDGDSVHNMVLKDNTGDIKFNLECGEIQKTLFGNKISVFLKDTVLDSPTDEWVVFFDLFVELMKSHGFSLVESQTFDELYEESFNMDHICKKVSFLNRTFVFRYTIGARNDHAYRTKCCSIIG